MATDKKLGYYYLQLQINTPSLSIYFKGPVVLKSYQDTVLVCDRYLRQGAAAVVQRTRNRPHKNIGETGPAEPRVQGVLPLPGGQLPAK